MSDQGKDWYYILNGKQIGPFSVDEFEEKMSEGSILLATQVWKEGMNAWQAVASVPELKAAFTRAASGGGKKKKSGELSALLELRPHEVDDLTSSIDSKSLRKAKKEANKATRVDQKAANRVHPKKTSLANKVMRLLFVVILGGGGTAFYLKWITVEDFKTETVEIADRILSPLPTLEDVPAADYHKLKEAVQKEISTAGPALAIVRSGTDEKKPVFVVSSNLPDGTSLNFYLHSIQGTHLTNKEVDIRFPLTLLKRIAQSKPLHLADGSDLPIGEYQVIVAEDDEQPAPVKALFASLPLSGESLPAYIPRGRRAVAEEKFFLGGARDEDYQSKLRLSRASTIPSSPAK